MKKFNLPTLDDICSGIGVATVILLLILVPIVLATSGCSNSKDIDDIDIADQPVDITNNNEYYHIEITRSKPNTTGYTKVYNEYIFIEKWNDIYKTYDDETGETIITIRYKKLDE